MPFVVKSKVKRIKVIQNVIIRMLFTKLIYSSESVSTRSETLQYYKWLWMLLSKYLIPECLMSLTLNNIVDTIYMQVKISI